MITISTDFGWTFEIKAQMAPSAAAEIAAERVKKKFDGRYFPCVIKVDTALGAFYFDCKLVHPEPEVHIKAAKAAKGGW